MDCEKSLELISEYRDKALDEALVRQVSLHLAECQPCAVVLTDINMIVLTATAIRNEAAIAFPDERVLWQRLGIAKGTSH